MRAILSVSDKAGIVDLGRDLASRKVELVSTGGTAKALQTAGLAVTSVSDITGQAYLRRPFTHVDAYSLSPPVAAAASKFASAFAPRASDHTQSRTSGMSSPCSRVYARA